MTITIHIPAEIEMRLRGEAARLGVDEAEVAIRALERSLPPPQERADGNWKARLDAMLADAKKWSASELPEGNLADDGRESIYEGRGE